MQKVVLENLATFTLNGGRSIVLGASGGTFLTDSGKTLTTADVISGSGSLTKIGAGTLDLTGTNTFTGALNMNGGTLQASADANLGAGSQINFNAGVLENLATLH